MLDRSSVGALGAIAAALALAALASLPPRAPAAAAAPAVRRPASARATSGALNALRDGGRIDLNHATAADLELLPGIGPSLAQRIVDDRAAHGAFENLQALQRVHGIGPRTLTRLQALVQVGNPGAGGSAHPPAP
jgi:competence protein ComEA